MEHAVRELSNAPLGPMAQIFLRESLHLRGLLCALPIYPSEIGSAFSPFHGARGHPIEQSLRFLNSLAASETDAATIGAMKACVVEAQSAVATIGRANAKREHVLQLVRDSPGALVVVKNQYIAEGLRTVLASAGLRADVVAWRDPVTWAPWPKPIILTTPPDLDHLWVLNARLGADAWLVFTRHEAAVLQTRLNRSGRAKGQGMKALEALARGPHGAPGPTAPRPLLPEDALRLLDFSHGPAVKAVDEGGTPPLDAVECVMIELVDGGIAYLRPKAKIAVIREGTVREVDATLLRPGDVTLLPVGDVDEDVQAAVFRIAESKPGNAAHAGRVHGWKSQIVAYASEKGLTAIQLAKALEGAGAPPLGTSQLRNVLGLEGADIKQIATVDTEPLVRASGRLLGIPDWQNNPRQVADSVSRLRGIHQNAGRALVRLAEAGYLSLQEELDAAVGLGLGLTQQELRALVEPRIVAARPTHVRVPPTMAGFRSARKED